MYRTVDVHNHYYPWDYLQHLVGRPGAVTAKQTGPHSYVMKCNDVIVAHIDRAGHYDMAARIVDLDKAGMDTQIMSKTVPGPELLERAEGVYWMKRINDAHAEAVQKYPHRLYAYAALAYQDVDESLKELERCIKDLKVRGIQMFSNVQGTPMHEPQFEPIFQMAAEHNLPILMHPTVPLTASILDKMKIPYQLYGYTFDTTMAVISLIFHGVFSRHKNLKVIHAHLGGMAPYLVRRLRDSWKGYSKEWGLELDEYPDDIYKRQVYPDTTSFYLPAMKCCLEWVGAEHMMIGTDYAHRVGDPEGAIKSILDLGDQAKLSRDQIDLILGKNAEKLFNLPPMPGKSS
ncbi:aminocarboxymuconate-semialdehyde decarboxylase [Roseiarcus fermentans]|uniref:Aminocarboxymuconate-semialdehyde decarboxylase n=1 Tax=Roseiarcus fermentans TaxID=1473586 RepID=A0A366EIL8_9HYPH|nr:amidohydrolase family protein [Roseiarcus fermentans]RBP02198.1 aminocarboxymuconate-semialdehyde decarboxylase [Roseiarcus fermentans]